MKNQEIFDFINANTLDNLKEFNKRLIEKVDDLSNKMNKISLWMILCVIIYYLFSASMISAVDVGFVTLTKLDIIPIAIPVLFSLSILYFLVLNNHYYELLQSIKIISFFIYENPGLEVIDFTPAYNNDYVRLMRPFSPWIELPKWQGKGQMNKFEAFLILPLLAVFIFPFIFEFIAVKRLFTTYWSYTFTKWAAVFSIWISIYTIFWVVRGWRVTTANLRGEGGILSDKPVSPGRDLQKPPAAPVQPADSAPA